MKNKNEQKLIMEQKSTVNSYSPNFNNQNVNGTFTNPNTYYYYVDPHQPIWIAPPYQYWPTYVPCQTFEVKPIEPLNYRHTRTPISKQPELFIQVNKSRLKVFGSKVYMNDNTEFELEIFNSSNETLGIKFKMNGKYISDNHLIIYPGKRMNLDRYLNEPKKFKYVTYSVENTSEAKEAIVNNGLVEIEFYREKQQLSTNKQPVSNLYYHSGAIDYFNQPTTLSNQNIGYVDGVMGYKTSINNADILKDEYTTEEIKLVNDFKSKTLESNKEIETGMIAKGSSSSTTFTDVNMQFEIFADIFLKYQIEPMSKKPIEAKDLIVYCSNCKHKSRKGDKHCSECGHKL